jgi:glyoxylase-like metal-dependent hydrolase (beta-lactamase superfamily II)
MPYYLCATCGVQYAESQQPPEHCIICEDERQYIGANGQQWTTLQDVQHGHHNTFTNLLPNLTSVVTEPKFAIGQRAHVVQTPKGNVLWDCISLIDDATVEKIQSMGGLSALALSHPHYYSVIVEWSHAFGNFPIYIHSGDREWVTRPDSVIQFWDGDTLEIGDGLTLIRCGGHFEGSTVMHWRDGADGKGVLLTGDSIFVVNDTRYVTFMYSFPNYIPLPARKVQHILDTVKPFAFDKIYDAFGRVVMENAHESVIKSAERYIKSINS